MSSTRRSSYDAKPKKRCANGERKFNGKCWPKSKKFRCKVGTRRKKGRCVTKGTRSLGYTF